MPDIYGSTGDGYADSGEQGTWAGSRNSSGVGVDNNEVRDLTATLVYRDSGKGGAEVNVIRRAFMFFDTSGISIAPSEATLKVFGFGSNSLDLIVVKSTAATITEAGSFNDLAGASTALGNTDGSGAGTLAGVSGLTYSAEIATWNAVAYNDIALNSTALSDMASLGDFKICIMSYDYDDLDIAPSLSGTLHRSGFWWTESIGTSRDPYIDYTAGVAVRDNSVFFGANF